MLERAGLGKLITPRAGDPRRRAGPAGLAGAGPPHPDPAAAVEIAIVGKYVELPDAYISVSEALKHAGSTTAWTSRCAGSAASTSSGWRRTRSPTS